MKSPLIRPGLLVLRRRGPPGVRRWGR